MPSRISTAWPIWPPKVWQFLQVFQGGHVTLHDWTSVPYAGQSRGSRFIYLHFPLFPWVGEHPKNMMDMVSVLQCRKVNSVFYLWLGLESGDLSWVAACNQRWNPSKSLAQCYALCTRWIYNTCWYLGQSYTLQDVFPQNLPRICRLIFQYFNMIHDSNCVSVTQTKKQVCERSWQESEDFFQFAAELSPSTKKPVCVCPWGGSASALFRETSTKWCGILESPPERDPKGS